jgi:hypothetical protein
VQPAINRTKTSPNENSGSCHDTTKNILFVAPSTCGQLQIAKYFWDFYKPEGFTGEFAALENNLINPWLLKSMESYGFCPEQRQVTSIFVLSTTSSNFSNIISMGGFESYTTISPFIETLDILFGKSPKRVFWDIPDSELIDKDILRAKEVACNIRDRIEFEMAQFAQSLEEAWSEHYV